MSQNKKIIAIIGGIGSGKSTVAQIMREWGYSVLDADAISKEVAAMPEILDRIRAEFGSEFINDKGLDRQALRAYVFGSDERTKRLNTIFHSAIIDKTKERLKDMGGKVFVEITVSDALPKGFADEVWEVRADTDIRIKRVMFRDNVRAEQVKDIINRQHDYPEPDVVIYNNGYIDELKSNLERIISD